MHKRRFELLVGRAVRSLPAGLLEKLDNVAIIVERRPSAEQLALRGLDEGDTLLGLYEGTPLTQRSVWYGSGLPDRITLFQEPIEEMCATDTEVSKQVQRTIIHEIGHFMGMTDEDLKRLGWR